jgi:FkbM family methyltransferase
MSIRSIIRAWNKAGKYSNNFEEPFDVQKSLLGRRKNLVIFDIGAYVGNVTAAYRKIFPQAKIYCFEPFPDSFKELNRLAEGDSVKPYQIAFSDRKAKTDLLINTDRTCNSMFERPVTGAKYYSKKSQNTGRIEVQTQTIDAFCQKENIEDIDILKLDVEGAELKVLNGAAGKLADKRIKLIFAEVMFVPHYKDGCLFHEVADFLGHYHYTLLNLYNLKTARNGQLRWANAIFLNQQMRDRIESSCS